MSITISLTPNRTSGVGPLMVYFDASATTSTATSFPFNQCAFAWDFGDPLAGNFATTGKSKNVAYGPLAAHVYETPGTYTVTLTVTDSAGTVAVDTVQITVTDPNVVFSGSNTIVVSRVGNFSGAPAGATQLTTTSFATVAAQFAAGKRILLRCGETWPITTGVTLDVAGPGIIGSFATGSKPRIEMTPSGGFGAIFLCSNPVTPLLNDWRIMDLDLNGMSDANSWGVYCYGGGPNLTLYRLSIANCGNGISAPTSQLEAHQIPAMNGLTVYECSVTDAVGGSGKNLVGITAARLVILGSEILRSINAEHVMRLFWVQGGVLSNCRLADAPQPRHLLKLHAPGWNTAGVGFHQYTEKMVISDNLFEGTGGTQLPVDVGPTNSSLDERLRQIVFERNYITVGPAVVRCSDFSVSELSVRWNIYNMGAVGGAIATRAKGVEPPPSNCWVQQNTCLSTYSGGPIVESLNAGATNIYVYNNLGAGPNAQTVLPGELPFVTGIGGNVNGTAAAAAFAGGAAPSSIDGFELTASSPALGQGSGVNTITPDFKQRSVTWGSGAPNDDAGALQMPEAATGNPFFFALPSG